jgi:hypothetical protein
MILIKEKLDKQKIRLKTKNYKEIERNSYDIAIYCKLNNIIVKDGNKHSHVYKYNEDTKELDHLNLRNYLENEFNVLISDSVLYKVSKYFRTIPTIYINHYNGFVSHERRYSNDNLVQEHYNIVSDEIKQEYHHQSQLKESYEIIDSKIRGKQ